MKIKAYVRLIWKTDYCVEELHYKIKYKIGSQKVHRKINKCVTTSWSTNWDEYMDDLYKYSRKEKVLELVKELIEDDIIKRGENVKLNNKHNQILQDIRNINREKIEFEFEIEEKR